MQSHTHTPAAIFGNQCRYVIPLFQRPYVWTRDDQWAPLWDDVRTLAERVLEAPPGYGAAPVPPHFLGAIVLDQQLVPAGFLTVRHVVDGQQRLTTLQLLLDAAQDVTERYGNMLDAERLKMLVLNQPQVTQHPDEVFKVWPTDRDQAAFRAAMDNSTAMPAELVDSRISQARAFFVDRITEWCEPTGDPDKAAARLSALAQALHAHLKLVVIDLEPGDNAQVIFETLNHRGAPLLAADLVKNLLFQRAQAEQLDVGAIYSQHWAPLDTDYWRELTAQGRLYRPRIDVFLNYWLTMKLLREVPSDRIFIDFRDHVATAPVALPGLMAELASDAAVFSTLDALPASSVPGRFYYRVIQALDTRAVMPVLLWLLRWPGDQLPVEQRDKALNAIESWLVRRTLARLTGKNINQTILELLKALERPGPASAGDRTEQFLAEQRSDARLWPDDDLVRRSLESGPVYTALLRARLRMVLEALEDDLRTDYGEGQPAPRRLTVEHILPQAWRQNWPIASDDVSASLDRDRLVHVLGNLTLVSGRLNPALSNRPWTKDDGAGKRDYLLEHSSLKLNAKVIKEHPTAWSDDDIRARTAALTERLLALWPRPSTPEPIPVSASAFDPQVGGAEPDDEDDVAAPSHTGKYQRLWRWLRAQEGDRIELAFEQVEQILDVPLPRSARVHLTHWYGYEGTALGRAIRDAGWRASGVDLVEQRLTFVRADAETEEA
ncbi:DUF262 domain-containing protein [Geodermatophilus sp. URMC 62]|uniref:DUF262 domain-containing protein n=1 Tax=Geodermatophilus sp. URMC 62 TaxID=3423414 RepID=UPI00406C546E